MREEGRVTPSESVFLKLVMTHDLSCTLGALVVAAFRIHPSAPQLQPTAPSRELMVAAVAFTIQLAIDEGGRDPAEMRVLERELIAKLEAPWR